MVVEMLTREKMIAAMIDRESRYDGVFYTGVVTTGIYCLPSCKARKPKPVNVVFFGDKDAAVASGFRACKRCKPHLFPDTGPDWMKSCLRYLEGNTQDRVPNGTLAEMSGVDISTLRRAFLDRFNKTPAQYHRDKRLDKAARLLAQKLPILQVTEECGYQSLSGFTEAFRKRFGNSPGRYER